jgi:hypothetical protein
MRSISPCESRFPVDAMWSTTDGSARARTFERLARDVIALAGEHDLPCLITATASPHASGFARFRCGSSCACRAISPSELRTCSRSKSASTRGGSMRPLTVRAARLAGRVWVARRPGERAAEGSDPDREPRAAGANSLHDSSWRAPSPLSGPGVPPPHAQGRPRTVARAAGLRTRRTRSQTQLRHRPSQGFVQILDRLDEVGLPDDHIQLRRLLHGHHVQLDLARALWHQPCRRR